MDLGHVGVTQFIYMGSMAFIGIVVPLAIALIWKFKKKERFTTILIGAATFLLFSFCTDVTKAQKHNFFLLFGRLISLAPVTAFLHFSFGSFCIDIRGQYGFMSHAFLKR